jgi:predicted O-methyltransferase YrrM
VQIVDERIERYALEHSSAQPPAMAALEADARSSLPLPEMLCGPVVGRPLELLVHGVQAKLVLEHQRGQSARAIASFNETVARDPRLSAAMLSVRDGITLIRRR